MGGEGPLRRAKPLERPAREPRSTGKTPARASKPTRGL